jgi:LysM repeat protein
LKRIINTVTILLLVTGAFLTGVFISRQSGQQPPSRSPNSAPATNTKRVAVAQVATSTLPPTTPLVTLTPSRTLKPPPTLEPPTNTLPPSPTVAPTASPTLDLSVNIPGLRGAESPTPTIEGCEPRKDWKLEYEIQRGDALATIAQKYGTYVSDLVKGNCLSDPNVIRIGQKIKVPGKAHPTVPAVVCEPFEALTPFDGTMNVDGNAPVVFNWHGPRSPRTLLRITRPDGSVFESVVELRQNESVDSYKNLWAAGTYKWQLFPLDNNFVQVCPESKFFVFVKGQGPTATVPSPSGPSAP